MKKWPNGRPVYGTGIRTHELMNMSRHPQPQPLDQGSIIFRRQFIFGFLNANHSSKFSINSVDCKIGNNATSDRFLLGADPTLFYVFKGAVRGLFFFNFRLFYKQLIVNKFNKSCRWLDSNPGPLVSEATALRTALFYVYS